MNRDFDRLPSIVEERLNYWKSKHNVANIRPNTITTLSIRVHHRNMVLLLKYSNLLKEWTLVFYDDSYQEKRFEKARKIMTSRQYEAFIYYENGAKNSRQLAQALNISERTAERYHANIAYYMKNRIILN